MQLLLMILAIAGFLVAALFDNSVGDDMLFQWPVYLAIAVAGVASAVLLKKRPRFLPSHLCLLMALIAFAYIFWRAYVATPTVYLGRQDWTLATATFTLYVLLAAVLVKVRQRVLFVYVITLLAALNSFVAIYEYTNSSFDFHILPGLFHPEYFGRASGLFANPNHLAVFLNGSILMSVSMILFGRPAPYTKLLYSLAALLSMVALALTKSRAGVASFAIGVLLLLCIYLILGRKFYRYYFRNKAIAICAGVVVVLGGLAWIATTKVGHRFDEGGFSDFRASHRQMAVELWHESPVIGSGARSFQFEALKFKETDEKWTLDKIARHTHCEYYQLLAEYGLIGFALVGGFVVLHFLHGIKFVRWFAGTKFERSQQPKSDTLGICLGATLGLVCLLCQAFWEFHFHVTTTCFLGAFFFAVLSNPGFEKIDYKHLRIPGVLLTTRIVVILGCALLLWKGSIYLPTEWNMEEASSPSTQLDYEQRVEILEGVIASDPHNFIALKALGQVHELRAHAPAEPEPLIYHLAAFSRFYEATQVNPLDIYAAVKTGWHLDYLERPEEAMAFYEKARENAPYHWIPYYYLGTHYSRLGDNEEAYRQLLKSAKYVGKKQRADNLKSAIDFVRKRLREEKKRPPGGP